MSEVLGGLVSKARATITDSLDLLLVFVGVGATDSLLAVVRSWFPEQTAGMTDEQLTAVIGFLIWYFGDRIHSRLVPFGFGVLASGVGEMLSGYISGIIESFKKAE